MRADLARLIHEYRPRGVLVDTTILLLFFVGSDNTRLITTFKRTHQFTEQDYASIVAILTAFNRRITTPHILTEVSTLAGQLPQQHR